MSNQSSQPPDLVSYRFKDLHTAREFIQPNSYEIQKKASEFTARDTDGLIEQIAIFIRDAFTYPLIAGQPSTDGQLLRFHKSLWNYVFKDCELYLWSWPYETLALFKAGVCIDTAVLFTSLMRAKNLPAWCCIGQVRTTDTDKLLGYHAWGIAANYKGRAYLDETTIHEAGVNTLVPQRDAYDRNSEFAKEGNIYYVEDGKWDEAHFIGTTKLGESGSIFQLLGKPQRVIKARGLERALQMSVKKYHNEWVSEELHKHESIVGAFSRRSDACGT